MPAQEELIEQPATASRGQRFTRPALIVLVLVTLLAVLALLAVVGAALGRHSSRPAGEVPPWPARAAQTGSSTCTDPSANQQWRVSWQVDSQVGVRPTGMHVRTLPDGAWQDRGNDRWQLRWSQAPAEVAGTDFAWDHAVNAPLSGLSQVAISASLSPRFVTPDGACTVYTAPFGPGAPGPGAIAVVGDSLVAQLVPGAATEFGSSGATVSPLPGATAPSPSATASSPTAVHDAPTAGPLLSALKVKGRRVQIDGQGGRRWIAGQEQMDPLDRANGTMVDELRGLREAGTVVVALGTNDANWVGLAPDDAQFETRLSWNLAQLRTTLDELAQHGHCTVLVTAAGRGKTNVSIPRSHRFELAVARLNQLMRERAEAEPRLALYDWGSQGDQHAHGTAESWFGPDTVHLSPAGVTAYTHALSEAAALGCS